MVDLVKQLREGVEKKYSRESLETMLLWAADEIERLRSDKEALATGWESELSRDYCGQCGGPCLRRPRHGEGWA